MTPEIDPPLLAVAPGYRNVLRARHGGALA